MILNDINNNYNDIFIHMQKWLKIMTTELANNGTLHTTLLTISLSSFNRQILFSPIYIYIYIVVRAVKKCVLSEDWQKYKSVKIKGSGEIGGGSNDSEE